jgi:hypothetical protein
VQKGPDTASLYRTLQRSPASDTLKAVSFGPVMAESLRAV